MRYFVLLLVVALSSCAGTPGTSTAKPAKASLSNTDSRSGLYTWENYLVIMVDGKGKVYWVSTKEKVSLKPGARQVVAKGSFMRGFLNGPYEAITDFVLDAKPGHSYTLRGKVDGAKVHMWIDDETTGQRVTPESVVDYRRTPPPPTPIYIPIVI